MTLQQFKYLSEKEQEYYLKKHAVLVSTAYGNNEIYTLFQIDGFYLEALSSEDETSLRSLILFEETDMLAPYLSTIDISHVYSILNTRGKAG